MPPRTDSGSEGGSKQLAFPQWGLLRSLPTLNTTERCFDPSHPVHSVHFANYSYCRCLGQTSSCCCMETWISFEIWKKQHAELWAVVAGNQWHPSEQWHQHSCVWGSGTCSMEGRPLRGFVSTTKWEGEAGMLAVTQQQKPSVCRCFLCLPWSLFPAPRRTFPRHHLRNEFWELFE